MKPVLCFNVTSGERHAGSCLACPEFLIVPTGAGNVAEDMITDTEVNHTLNSVIKRTYGGMRATPATRQVLLRLCSSTTKRWTSSRIILSRMKVPSHVESEESSHEWRVSFAHPDFQECSIQLCADT